MSSLWIILIPVLPLLAFVANGLLGRRLGRAGGWLAVCCMAVSAAISAILFISALSGRAALPIHVSLWEWISVGRVAISFGMYVDQLTCLMLFFVTLVSTLVFLYSMGYMAGDGGFNRFFAYLGLFDFCMLVLVLADSLPVLFIGWEGVGLCSYLLIGYFMSMPGAADAGKKAFIVNRIGDFGFLIAMFMLLNALGTLNIQEIISRAPTALAIGGGSVTIITLMLLLGCTGKSAQIPLFVWLPDAMAGPTPVSALIHAATMVTAGVYLVVRMSGLFVLAPATMTTMAGIGALTAFVAGSIALTQRDIKKVLAYSTVSQLGLMFLGCGVGAFVGGIFHVFTHSFFKACLFLGAGSVIHASHEQDVTRLGGLRSAMPRTWLTFLVACLAIAGIPPLAGFFSKDEILARTFEGHHVMLYVIGLFVTVMTGAYSFRILFLTFHGKSRLNAVALAHAHESPPTMTLPLILLAIGAVVAGFLNLPHGGMLSRFLGPVVAPVEQFLAAHPGETSHFPPSLEYALMFVAFLCALFGIAAAAHFAFRDWPNEAARWSRRLAPLYQLSYHRWWWDDFYNWSFAGGTGVLARLATWFDRFFIDGILHTIGAATSGASRFVRWLQNGQVQAYALIILIGVNVVLWIVMFFK